LSSFGDKSHLTLKREGVGFFSTNVNLGFEQKLLPLGEGGPAPDKRGGTEGAIIIF